VPGDVIANGDVDGDVDGDVGLEVDEAMLTLRAAEAVFPVASVTLKVKLLVPAFWGVPDRRPEALKPNPVLQAPEHCTIVH